MTSNKITHVGFDDGHIELNLADGRMLRVPTKRHIRVEKATPEQRLEWVLTDDDHGVNWPKLWEPDADGMVSVWDIEQDMLYDAALGRLQAAGWDVSTVSRDDYELVALWRLEADINNGGFMQFFCNWGEPNCRVAMEALQRIGASAARQLVTDMYGVIAPYGETDAMVSLAELPGLLTEADNERLEVLDEAFWDYPERLSRLVVQTYGAGAP